MSPGSDNNHFNEDPWVPEAVVVPISDELDLHTFNPRELGELLPEYLRACQAQGIFSLRIIHGKGMGILKERVRALLKKDPRVISFDDAPPEAGGWGATLVSLSRD
ncbi:MAG: Smr/MutS family protein [Desulfobacterales bacterium]